MDVPEPRHHMYLDIYASTQPTAYNTARALDSRSKKPFGLWKANAENNEWNDIAEVKYDKSALQRFDQAARRFQSSFTLTAAAGLPAKTASGSTDPAHTIRCQQGRFAALFRAKISPRVRFCHQGISFFPAVGSFVFFFVLGKKRKSETTLIFKAVA